MVQYITNVEDKSVVILEAVKNAPVPWSDVITGLCDTGSQLQHTNSVLIKEQQSLVRVKTILRKYDCKSYMTTGRQAERLLITLMRKGGEEGFNDALEISSVIGGKNELELEKMFVQHLLEEKQDAVLATQRIKNMMIRNMENGMELCADMVSCAKLILKLEIGNEIETSYMDVVRNIVATLTSNKKHLGANTTAIISKAQSVIKAHILKVEFGLVTSLTSMEDSSISLSDPVMCRQQLHKFIIREVKFMDETNEKCQDEVRKLYTKITKLCDMLGVEQEEALAGLVLRLEALNMLQSAVMVTNIIQVCIALTSINYYGNMKFKTVLYDTHE